MFYKVLSAESTPYENDSRMGLNRICFTHTKLEPLLELLSCWCLIPKSSHCNSFEDWVLVDVICGCLISKCGPFLTERQALRPEWTAPIMAAGQHIDCFYGCPMGLLSKYTCVTTEIRPSSIVTKNQTQSIQGVDSLRPDEAYVHQ